MTRAFVKGEYLTGACDRCICDRCIYVTGAYITRAYVTLHINFWQTKDICATPNNTACVPIYVGEDQASANKVYLYTKFCTSQVSDWAGWLSSRPCLEERPLCLRDWYTLRHSVNNLFLIEKRTASSIHSIIFSHSLLFSTFLLAP